jgi:hypothetical protein
MKRTWSVGGSPWSEPDADTPRAGNAVAPGRSVLVGAL